MQNIMLFFLGFVTGMRHALDADHLAAVSSLVTKHNKLSSAIWAGSWWGAGHTLTLMVVGFFILVFGLTIPEKVQMMLEILVGVMLVILGTMNLKTGFMKELHLHKHKHDAHEHLHLHVHEEGKKPHDHKHNHANNVKAFIVGSVHGMAGSAAVMLLVLATIKSVALGLIYIFIFGAGSILGMVLFSLIIGLPISMANRRLNWMDRLVTTGGGMFSIMIGILLIKEISSKMFL